MDSSQSAFDQNSAPLAGPFNVGSVLSRAFSTLFKNPVVFFGLALIAVAPSIIIQILMGENAAAGIIARIVGMILGCVVQGATAYGVYCVLRERTATVGDSVSRGMARIAPLVGTAVLAGIGIGIASLFLVIPGVVMMCIWAVAIPACVIEGLGPNESLRRSGALTLGYRLPIFVLMLITSIASIVVVFGVGAIVGGATGSVAVGAIAAAIGLIAIQAFSSVMSAVIYYDLRMLKEGVGLDNLAKIFD